MYPFKATNINGMWFVVNSETGKSERCHNRQTAQYLAKSKGDARHAFIGNIIASTVRSMGRRDDVPHFPAEDGCCDRHDAEMAAWDRASRAPSSPENRAQARRIKRKLALREKARRSKSNRVKTSAKIVEREQA